MTQELKILGVYRERVEDHRGAKMGEHAVLRLATPTGRIRDVVLTPLELATFVAQAAEIMRMEAREARDRQEQQQEKSA